MEIIVAMGIIISILTSSLVLITLTVNSTKTSRSKIIAINLSQEGLEIVRNIRDNNWLAGYRSPLNWRQGLGPGNYRAVYDKAGLLPYAAVALDRDTGGFYFYTDQGARAGSVATPFQRTITIEHIDNNQIKVVSEVTWSERGRNQVISAETRFYNWLEET